MNFFSCKAPFPERLCVIFSRCNATFVWDFVSVTRYPYLQVHLSVACLVAFGSLIYRLDIMDNLFPSSSSLRVTVYIAFVRGDYSCRHSLEYNQLRRVGLPLRVSHRRRLLSPRRGLALIRFIRNPRFTVAFLHHPARGISKMEKRQGVKQPAAPCKDLIGRLATEEFKLWPLGRRLRDEPRPNMQGTGFFFFPEWRSIWINMKVQKQQVRDTMGGGELLNKAWNHMEHINQGLCHRRIPLTAPEKRQTLSHIT